MAWLVVVLLASASSMAAAEPLRLAEVLARVEVRGPEQLAVNAEAAVAQADIRGARMWPNPGLVIGGGRSEPLFDAAVQLHLPIFGQREARVRASRQSALVAAGEAEAARWRLRHDARLAYWTVARADEQVAIAVEVEALVGRIAEMAREKYQVGSGTRLDQRQAELVHVRALQEVSDRRAAARVSRLELARQLASVDDGPLADPLARSGATPPLDELLAAARDHHPELRALRGQREAALLRAAAARAELRPLPTLELGVELLDAGTYGGSSRCVGPRGALSFDLPLFNFNGGPIERAKAEARLAERRAAAIEARLVSGLRAAYENLTAATARARFFDLEYVPNALEVEAMAREAFAVGRSGILPLVEAERAVLDARLGRTEALYAVQAARANLEEQSGVALSAP